MTLFRQTRKPEEKLPWVAEVVEEFDHQENKSSGKDEVIRENSGKSLGGLLFTRLLESTKCIYSHNF